MSVDPRKPSLVAVVASPEDMADPILLSTGIVELCELRIDLLNQYLMDLEKQLAAISAPIIVTVRDPAEGGARSLTEESRRHLLERWLPFSSYVDIELRNLKRYSDLVRRAELLGKGVIVSYHDFGRTPTLEELEKLLADARVSEANIFKIATRVSQWADVSTLVNFLERNRSCQIAAMGVGEFGKLSRVVLARMGSCLTYCSLGKAVAPGQWPYVKLKEILSELWD
jgi:3-dehydroquinate dehydratase I